MHLDDRIFGLKMLSCRLPVLDFSLLLTLLHYRKTWLNLASHFHVSDISLLTTQFSIFLWYRRCLYRPELWVRESETHLLPLVSYCFMFLMKWIFFACRGLGDPPERFRVLETGRDSFFSVKTSFKRDWTDKSKLHAESKDHHNSVSFQDFWICSETLKLNCTNRHIFQRFATVLCYKTLRWIVPNAVCAVRFWKMWV